MNRRIGTLFRRRSVASNGLLRGAQHVLMTCEPALAQLHEAERFKRQRRRRTDFQLTIDLHRQFDIVDVDELKHSPHSP